MKEGKKEFILSPGLEKNLGFRWFLHLGRLLGDGESNRMRLGHDTLKSFWQAMTLLHHSGTKKSKVLCTELKVNPLVHFRSFPRSLRFFYFNQRKEIPAVQILERATMGCCDKNQVIAIVYTMSKESHILIEIFTRFGNVTDLFQQVIVPNTLTKKKKKTKKNKNPAVGKLARLPQTGYKRWLISIFDYYSNAILK